MKTRSDQALVRVIEVLDDFDDAERLLRKPVNGLAPIAQSERITVLARKSYNVLLWIAQGKHRQGEDGTRYSAALSEIVHLLDYNSNETSLIKRHLEAMVQTTVKWQSPTEGEGSRWEVSGLLAWASLTSLGGQTMVSWEFSSALREEILNPNVFAQLRMEVLSQLRTHPGVFLYELACRYVNVGRSSKRPWRWWHDPLTGRPPDEARLNSLSYAVFKRDVLKTALAEVNAITPFNVVLLEYRKGKFITDIQFGVSRKAQTELGLEVGPPKADLASVVEARDLGIPEARVEQFVDQFGSDALASALPELRKRVQEPNLPPVRDLPAYLRSMLPAHADKAQKFAREVEERKDPASPRSRAIQLERQQAWRMAWRSKRIAQIEQQVMAMSAPEQLALSQQLLEHMRAEDVHPQIIKRLERNGWTHDLVKDRFLRYYAEGAIGPDWDKPEEGELLEIAAHMGDAGVR